MLTTWALLLTWATTAFPQAPPPPWDEAYSLTQGVQTSVEFDAAGHILAGGPSIVRVYAVPGAGNVLQGLATFEPRGCVTGLFPLTLSATVIVRTGANDLSVWDHGTGKPLKYALEDAAAVSAFERRGSQAETTASGTVLPTSSGLRLWDPGLIREKRPRILERRVERCGDVAISGVTVGTLVGTDLLTGDGDGFVLRSPLGAIPTPTLDASGQSGGAPPRAPRSPKNVGAFHPHAGTITRILALPGASRGTWVTASLDGTVKGWADIPTLAARRPAPVEPAWTLTGHFAEVRADGRRLAVAERDGVRVYELPSRTVVSWIPAAGRGRPLRLRFSLDGTLLAAVFCACSECAGVQAYIAYRKPLEEHGGPLIVWRSR